MIRERDLTRFTLPCICPQNLRGTQQFYARTTVDSKRMIEAKQKEHVAFRAFAVAVTNGEMAWRTLLAPCLSGFIVKEPVVPTRAVFAR